MKIVVPSEDELVILFFNNKSYGIMIYFPDLMLVHVINSHMQTDAY